MEYNLKENDDRGVCLGDLKYRIEKYQTLNTL